MLLFLKGYYFPFNGEPYSPFNGEPIQYQGWIILQLSLMYEDGLGKIMSGVETAPAAMEESATQLQKTQHAKECRRFD